MRDMFNLRRRYRYCQRRLCMGQTLVVYVLWRVLVAKLALTRNGRWYWLQAGANHARQRARIHLEGCPRSPAHRSASQQGLSTPCEVQNPFPRNGCVPRDRNGQCHERSIDHGLLYQTSVSKTRKEMLLLSQASSWSLRKICQ